MRKRSFSAILLLLFFVPSSSLASEDSNGPNGINSIVTGLTGEGIQIGQVEGGRPGKFGYDTDEVNTDVDIAAVFAQDMAAGVDEGVRNHSLWVASVINSTQTATDPNPPGRSPPIGVAQGVVLYSSAWAAGPMDPQLQIQNDAAISAQFLAPAVFAINMSFGMEFDESSNRLDGSSTLSAFIDWSTRVHEVLYVVAGNELTRIEGPVPTDNYNGITVAASSKASDGVFRNVAGLNQFGDSVDAFGDRTSTDILAPGVLLDVAGKNGSQPERGTASGTSLAAPHVTGTIALLHERANTTNGHRHEVIKAVIMNSADKIKGIIGMERTVSKLNESKWPVTPHTAAIPLDQQMGGWPSKCKTSRRPI